MSSLAIGLILILITLLLMGVFAFLDRNRVKVNFRQIPSLESLQKSINLVVEGGKGVHISIGRGNYLSPQFAGSLVGLNLLKFLTRRCLNGDIPPLSTSGDGLLHILSQETLDFAYERSHLPEKHGHASAQVAGLTPYSYIGGAMMAQRDEQQAVMLLAGHYGAEAALLADMAERSRSHTISGTDDISAQAMLFVTTRAPLIGEELFAAPAYTNPTLLNTSSLKAQDALRVLLALGMVIGGILKLVGVW